MPILENLKFMRRKAVGGNGAEEEERPVTNTRDLEAAGAKGPGLRAMMGRWEFQDQSHKRRSNWSKLIRVWKERLRLGLNCVSQFLCDEILIPCT